LIWVSSSRSSNRAARRQFVSEVWVSRTTHKGRVLPATWIKIFNERLHVVPQIVIFLQEQRGQVTSNIAIKRMMCRWRWQLPSFENGQEKIGDAIHRHQQAAMSLIRGKGPISLGLHCIVMARECFQIYHRAPFCTRRYFLSSKNLTSIKYNEQRGNRYHRKVSSFDRE
jgi:hypothetical protein